MSLEERLLQDQKEAARAGDRFRLTVIRMLRSELHNAAIAKKAPLDSGEELAVLAREVKKREESRADYERAGRPEALEELNKEITLLKGYLPPPFSAAELKELVRRAVAEAGATSKKDFGRVMGLLMPRVRGRADGNTVRRAVEEELA